MFGHKKPKTAEVEQPERLHYTKYYEHDGALRAYANRAMVLACSMSLLAFFLWLLPYTCACSRQPSFAFTPMVSPRS